MQLDLIQKSMPILKKIVLEYIERSKHKNLPMLSTLSTDLDQLIRDNVLKQPTHLSLPVDVSADQKNQQFETIVVNQIHQFIPYPEQLQLLEVLNDLTVFLNEV